MGHLTNSLTNLVVSVTPIFKDIFERQTFKMCDENANFRPEKVMFSDINKINKIKFGPSIFPILLASNGSKNGI